MKAKFIVNFETEFESDTVWYKGCGYRTGSATNVVCEASSYGSKRSFSWFQASLLSFYEILSRFY